MANSFKGQIAVQHNGREIVLVMDFNALADFETATEMDALAWLDSAAKGKASVREMRTMVWAAMHQRDDAATIRDAGDLLSDQPDVLIRLVVAASPEATPGNAPRPQKRAAKR